MTRRDVQRLGLIGLKYGLGITLLVYVVRTNWSHGDGRGIGEALDGPLETGPLLAAFAMAAGSLVLMAVRWYMLTRALDLPVSLWHAVRFQGLGYFLGNVLPGSVGGDLGRAVVLARGQERRTAAVATVLVDGAVALWSLLLLVLLAGSVRGLVGDGLGPLRFFVQAALAGVVGGVAAFLMLGLLKPRHAERLAARLGRFPTVQHAAADLFRAAHLYRHRTGTLVLAVAASLAAQVAAVLSFYLAARVLPGSAQLGSIPSLAEHCVLVPVGMLIQFGFPAPGGMGGGEYAYGVLYALALANPDGSTAGVLAALVARAVAFAVGVCGYVVYLTTGPRPVGESRPAMADERPELPSAA